MPGFFLPFLDEYRWFSCYWYSCFGNHSRQERYTNIDPPNSFDQKEFSYYSAVGVGIRVNFLQVLSFNLHVGQAVGFGRSGPTPYYINPSLNYNSTIADGAGLYFY